jgi:hypothetical protein
MTPNLTLMVKLPYSLLCILLFISSGCTILKKEDPEKQAADFLLAFQQSLSGDEKTVLDFFDTRQSRESILSAISVLQNKASDFILCEPAFNAATVAFEEEGVNVTIPITFRSQKTDSQYTEATTLNLFLKGKKDGYVISNLAADQFYETFAKIKNEMQWEVQREQAFIDREKFYSMANALEQKFDSVIWYTSYQNELYFYVVSGSWDNYFRRYDGKTVEVNATMGLVNKDGRLVIPIEYDLIGTLGFNFKGIAEVKKNNKVGYFDFTSKEVIVPVAYDVIIPYGKEGVFCVVKSDSTYGYYDYDHQYKAGFPSEKMKNWVDNFSFIPENLQLKAGNQPLCEIPAKEHAGYGIIIPPSYLVRTGIFKEFVTGITSTDFPLEGWTEFVQTEGTVSQRISESLLALVTTIKERYLEGREEFYTHNKLVFYGPDNDTLAVENLTSGGVVDIHKVDGILEVKYSIPSEYYFEESFWPDRVPQYIYYDFSEDLKIERLKSKRYFAQTQFVKLDSSYFAGHFQHLKVDIVDGEQVYGREDINFISVPTIQYMHDEILASYGVRVINKDNNNFEIFTEVPEVSLEQAEGMYSDIDRHNITFLKTLLQAGQDKNI